MMDTTTEGGEGQEPEVDFSALEYDPEVRFWGGPLDGLVLEPMNQKLPDRDHNLFRHPYGVIHDPDGPNRTVYAFCPVHFRHEALRPGAETGAAPLEPDDE